MPLHAAALDLLKATGPMAVSSANTTGRPAATTADEALEQLGDAVSVYLDGGPCGGGVASTIIDLTGSVPRLLRAGAISMDRMREVAALITGEEVSPPGADDTAGVPDTNPGPEGTADAEDTAGPQPDGPPDIPSDSPADARADALAGTAAQGDTGAGEISASAPEAWEVPGAAADDETTGPADATPEAPAEELMSDSAQAQQAADDPAAPVTSEAATAQKPARTRKPARPRQPATRKTPANGAAPEEPASEAAATAPKTPATRKTATTRKTPATRKPAAERKTTPRRPAVRKTTPADPPTLGDQTDTVSQPGDAEPGGPA
jgi:hypothetical protein